LKMKWNRGAHVWRASCHKETVRNFKERRNTHMTTVPKLIKAAISFSKVLPEQLLALGYNVLKNLTGNVNFPNVPVDLDVLKSTLDAYSISIGEAKDGGRKAILLRNQQGEDIIRMLRALASHVELHCKDDINIFLTSGFQPRSTSRGATQPMAVPMITDLEQGPSGTLVAWIKGVRKAKTYEFRVGAVGDGGALPTSWSTRTVTSVRSGVISDGLTPATTYAIQVRAYGSLGYTEWSPAATRMVI
jgi:hypothetical protein